MAIVDEFSMVGNKFWKYSIYDYKRFKGNNTPFGGINVNKIEDLFQLKHVYDDYIFNNLKDYYGPCARNLWSNHILIFELI